MLSEREAFKVGFLARCAELGLSDEEALDTVKAASDKLAGVWDATVNMAKTVGYPAMGLALAAPPAAGALAGYGLAKARDIDDTDVAALKDQEVIDAYKAESARLRRQRAVRDYAKLRHQTGRVFI